MLDLEDIQDITDLRVDFDFLLQRVDDLEEKVEALEKYIVSQNVTLDSKPMVLG